MPRWSIRDFIDLLHREHGSALVEFSLFLPMLILMLMGVVDLGLAIQQRMIVQEAAHAGALYATLSGKNEDVAGMQSAAKSAGAGAANLVVNTPVLYCASSATGVKTQGSPGCSTSSLEWAQVTTSASLPALFGYQFGSISFNLFTLNGFSEMRVR